MFSGVSSRINRPVILGLVLIAIAIRAVMPSGYMLDVSDANTLIMRICNAAGEVREMKLDLVTGEYTQIDKSEHETGDGDALMASPCAQASLAFASAIFALTPSLNLAKQTATHAYLTRAPPISVLARPSLPARGPPIYSQ